MVSPTLMTARRTPSRRHSAWCAALAALLVLVAASPAPAQAADPAGSGGAAGSALKAEYDEVLGAEAALEEAITTQARRMIQIGAEINDLMAQLRQVDLQVVAARRHLATKVAEDRAARAALAAAVRRMQRATDQLHAQAIGAYIGGGIASPSVDMLLQSFEGSIENERASSYADVLVEHQRAVVAEFRAARAARTAASGRAAKARAAATALRDAMASWQRDLQVKRVQLEQLKVDAAEAADLQLVARVKLVSKKIDIEARITQLDKASDGIGQFLASAQARQPDYVPGAIAFTIPMPGIKPGSPFGQRFHPILHITRLHAGIDFGAPAGHPIRAAADGVVVIAGERGGYGNATVIDHGSSIATVYAHQSQIIVHVGQRVRAGDVIGAVGTTGLSTGPHLHFETRVKGVPVNPTSFIDFGAAPADSGTGD